MPQHRPSQKPVADLQRFLLRPACRFQRRILSLHGRLHFCRLARFSFLPLAACSQSQLHRCGDGRQGRPAPQHPIPRSARLSCRQQSTGSAGEDQRVPPATCGGRTGLRKQAGQKPPAGALRVAITVGAGWAGREAALADETRKRTISAVTAEVVNTSTSTRENINKLIEFRQKVYACVFLARRDALFDALDALLCGGTVSSFAWLSQNEHFQRKCPSLYAAVEEGRIDTEAMCALIARQLPQEGICIFPMDGSSWPRPRGQVLEDLQYVYQASSDVDGGAVTIGCPCSLLEWCAEPHSRWSLPLDVRRHAKNVIASRTLAKQSPVSGSPSIVRQCYILV